MTATCLADNISTITAISNDYSYDDVFLHQLKYILNKKDILITISGSGNSTNVIKAAEYAKSIIGTNLVTYQTDSHGQPVNSVLVAEDVYPVERELY